MGLRSKTHFFFERILQGMGYFYCCVDISTHGGHKWALYPLELELEMPISHKNVGYGI